MTYEINNNIYRITFYGNTRFIQCETKQDLFKYVAEQTIKGFTVMGVNLISPNGKTPRIPVKTDEKYKKILKELSK